MGLRRVLIVAVAVAVVCVSGAWAASSTSRPDPRKAAKQLVAGIHHSRLCTFAASKVVSRHGRLWLAVSTGCSGKSTEWGQPTHVRIFLWSGRKWLPHGTVNAQLANSQSIDPASLTGSSAPDWAITGCGAGGIVCLSVITHDGGRWHAVPFDD